MAKAIIFENHEELISYCLRKAPMEGFIAEFGVASGSSIKMISRNTEKDIHGFDVFDGLPNDWSGHLETKGAFSQRRLPKVPDNVRLHKGIFEDTIPRFFQENRESAAFLHVDCDIYESTVSIFNGISDRIKIGTVILFDEYFNYPAWRHHEFKAWQEFVSIRSLKYEYIAVSAADGKVAVRVLEA